MASPFFPAIKGVLVNRAESWEEEFDQTDEQWLVYRDTLHESQDAGIGVILLNHYASFAFGADFILPFIQFFKRYDGTLSESERWLGELGELSWFFCLFFLKPFVDGINTTTGLGEKRNEKKRGMKFYGKDP